MRPPVDSGPRRRVQLTDSVPQPGPQLGWRTVYVIEYLGPLLIHPLLYLLRPYIYANPDPDALFPPPALLQTLTLACVTLHFLKRELETVFVHTFTQATMPARNLLKNSAHYWGLAGLLVAYFVYAPNAPAARPDAVPWLTYPGLALFVAGELGNAYAHLVFAGLRKRDGEERGIPRGIAFGWVTSPNYMFEALAWAGLCAVSMSWATALFSAVAVYQMAVWAKVRERRNQQSFGDRYKRKRYVMFPGIY